MHVIAVLRMTQLNITYLHRAPRRWQGRKPACSTGDMFFFLRQLPLVTTYAGLVLGMISSSVDDHTQTFCDPETNLPARVPYVFPLRYAYLFLDGMPDHS